jgi:hypothetical protein
MNIPTLEFDAFRVADFILRNYEPARKWADPVGYCAWYVSQGFLAMVCNDEGEIVAVVSMRPVMNPGDGAVPYRFDPEGTCIFIDLLIVKNSPLSMAGLAYVFKARFGEREKVAYFRRSEERLRIHDYSVFFKNVTRMKSFSAQEMKRYEEILT